MLKKLKENVYAKYLKATVKLTLLMSSMFGIVPAAAKGFSAKAVNGEELTQEKATGFVNTIIGSVEIIAMVLGGIVLLWGGIQAGLGSKDEDAEKISKGIRTAIAGAIVLIIGIAAKAIIPEIGFTS